MVPQFVINVNFPTRPVSILVGGVITIGVCPTAVVDLQTTPPVNVVDVGFAVGVRERVGTAVGVGVGVSETVGVGVVVGVADGVLEQAESPPATTSAIAAKYIPRFTS